ncbi:MFS transporter [Stenotrophobium rhamnosiphilum]|uniref:MFS transporter n=1 Tax=Stenotrophobium rhamnosiphilum TaxID=2029166 RepID=A0A2T5MEM8_9GAMM|nr:MFS transporter [Stenotrophobium rhamnosiphilum]PTU31026.1 MFS transporter [Stenotrophobium rhamnosiphilum]
MKRGQLSWAMYDWANSAFATTVLAGFFPIFFAKYWAADLADAERTWWLGWGGAIASLIVMIMAPLLGGVADRKGYKKRFLFLMMVLGAGATMGLYGIDKGDWQSALIMFTLASIGFFGGLSFYDSLIVHVADKEEMDRVSALGYGLGYLGGGLLFAINVAMVLKPEVFGLADAAIATRLSFLSVGVWWLVFSIPLFLRVPETAKPDGNASFAALWATAKQLVTMKPVLLFLCAYWLYIDGVDTIIRMAVDYGIKLGFEPAALIKALLLVQFIGFPAAIAFGYLADRIGTKNAIYLALAVYAGVTCFAFTLQTEAQFYGMAAVIALVQGGVQSLSRSYYAKLIPLDRAGEFFGFYNMLGKFAAIGGPIAIAVTANAVSDQRYSILALLPFFILGALLLSRVRPETTR